MKINEYQIKAHEFAKYEDSIYPVYGLIEETGELFGKLAKEKRGDYKISKTAIDHIKIINPLDVIKELGDICWMLSEIATQKKITLEFNVFKINSDFNRSLINIFLALNLLCENMLLDCIITNDDFEHIFVYINRIAGFYGYSFEDVLNENIKKLQSRKERDMINGNGDNR